MRAAVLRAPGILELEDIPDPELPKGGALLEIKACAVCGTDIKMRYQGHRDLVYPAVLGHEMVGRILELDGAGSSLAEGDLVQIWPGIACGRCRQCLRGQDNLCQEIKIMGFNTQGGFADLMALPAECLSRSINPIPEDTDCDLLALTEPLACCCNGQIKATVRRGDCILILGGGPIGALHALLAQIHGAERIIIAEKLPSRICLLKKHTNSVVFDPRIEEPKDVVAAETDGQGADVILSATPEIPLDCDILSLLSPGGRACVFSGPSPGHHQKTIDMRLIHYKESAVVGAYGCTSSQCRSAADLLTSGRIRADWLITKRSSLAKIDEAFAHCALRSGMKSIVCA